jgi:hypothetical protein
LQLVHDQSQPNNPPSSPLPCESSASGNELLGKRGFSALARAGQRNHPRTFQRRGDFLKQEFPFDHAIQNTLKIRHGKKEFQGILGCHQTTVQRRFVIPVRNISY